MMTKRSLFELIEFHGSILEKKEGIDIQYIERCLALLNRQKNEK
jgi:hypothetical protein